MTEAGWHPDPSGGDGLRWFDGQRWTEHVSAPPKAEVIGAVPAEATSPTTAMPVAVPEPEPEPEPEPGAEPEPRPWAQPVASSWSVARRRWAAALAVVAAIELLAGAVLLNRNPSVELAEPASSREATAPADPAPASSTTTVTEPPTTVQTTTTAAPVSPVDETAVRALRLPDDACSAVVDPGISRQLVDGASSGPDGQGLEITGSALGDLDGDGIGDAAVVVACYSGGTLVPFGVWGIVGRDRSVIEVPFGEGVATSWELDVGAPTIRDGSLVLEIGASEEWDAHCCPSIDVTETLRFTGGRFERSSIDTVGVAQVHRRLVEAVAARDLSTIASLTTTEVRAALDDLITNYGALRIDETIVCGRELGDAYCLVSAGGWAGEVTWRRNGVRSWTAVGYSDIGGGM